MLLTLSGFSDRKQYFAICMHERDRTRYIQAVGSWHSCLMLSNTMLKTHHNTTEYKPCLCQLLYVLAESADHMTSQVNTSPPTAK